MKILGIDPGSRSTGFGVIEYQNNTLRHIESGTIPASIRGYASSLTKIFSEIEQVIAKHHPAAVAVEEVFFATNVQSALKLGQARGVILLAIFQSGVPFFEYSPLEVKKAVTGYGRADKRQVQFMTTKLLHLRSSHSSLDASDALAVAICHAHSQTRWATSSHVERFSGDGDRAKRFHP